MELNRNIGQTGSLFFFCLTFSVSVFSFSLCGHNFADMSNVMIEFTHFKPSVSKLLVLIAD